MDPAALVPPRQPWGDVVTLQQMGMIAAPVSRFGKSRVARLTHSRGCKAHCEGSRKIASSVQCQMMPAGACFMTPSVRWRMAWLASWRGMAGRFPHLLQFARFPTEEARRVLREAVARQRQAWRGRLPRTPGSRRRPRSLSVRSTLRPRRALCAAGRGSKSHSLPRAGRQRAHAKPANQVLGHRPFSLQLRRLQQDPVPRPSLKCRCTTLP